MPSALSDHYRTLGVSPAAGAEEIKRAYRALARRYHPDAAPDNPHAAAQFRDIQKAYAVVSDPSRRRRYDEERWLTGMQASGKRAEPVSPVTLLRDATRFRQHVQSVGIRQASPGGVQRMALFLLRDAHLAVLAAESDADRNGRIAEAIEAACAGLSFRLYEPVAAQLEQIRPVPEGFPEQLAAQRKRRKAAQAEAARRPYVILLFTILLCAFIWLLARR